VKVVVHNPTVATGQSITLSGQMIPGGGTCTDQSASYEIFTNLYLANGDNEFILPVSGGLRTGMWVHKIQTGVGQQQWQQGVVLVSASADPNTYTRVDWTFHPSVINVNVEGDAGMGTCTSSCTFRQALQKANLLPANIPSTLIRFSVSPGQMTQTANLTVGTIATGPITIDGTDSNGNPWIVGDALAAAQGNQDPFTRVIDLANTTKLVVVGDDVTIKGLEIKNSTGGAVPSGHLIESSAEGTHLEAIRLDGGAVVNCGVECWTATELVRMDGTSTIANVEGHSAYGSGAELDIGPHEVRDSWFHHNYGANLEIDDTSVLRNVLELAGVRKTDDVLVNNNSASGIVSMGVADIDTEANLIRNNSTHGLEIDATVAGTELVDDYICGNDEQGIFVDGATGATLSGTGMTTAYNAFHGIEFDAGINSGTLALNNDNAFTANGQCGLSNLSNVSVSANNNQWRDAITSCLQSNEDLCAGMGQGPVTCSSIQSPFGQALFNLDGQRHEYRSAASA
jgi:hypothetical protein